jgi:putative aldouronate transport system permease protein
LGERRTVSDRAFDIVNYALLTCVLFVMAYPLYFVVVASISEPRNVWTGRVWLWPIGFNLEGYGKVLRDQSILVGYRNSIIYTTLGTLINLAMTLTAAYPLSRKDLKGRRFFMFVFTFTMFFSGGLIPTYLVVRALGMLNTLWAMVIPNAVAVWYIILVRTYFASSIPQSMYDAAVMDGCSNFRFFVLIVIPISPAIIAVMALFYAVDHWNSYFEALIYLYDKNRYPLQLVLRNILIMSKPSAAMLDAETLARLYQTIEMVKYAVIVVASVPLLLLYPFVQKYFVKGIMIGSLKG